MAGDGGATIYTVNSWGKAKKVDCQNMEAGLLIQLEALIAAEIDRRRETGDLAAMADRPADQIALMDKAQTSNRKAGGWSNQAALYQEVIHRIRQLERQLAAQRRPQAACRDEERKALRAAMEDRVNTGMGCRTGTGCSASTTFAGGRSLFLPVPLVVDRESTTVIASDHGGTEGRPPPRVVSVMRPRVQ